MKTKFYYPVRDAENPSRVSLVEVSEEFYRAVQPEIDRVRKQKQRNSTCFCPKKMLWTCNIDCTICPYNAGDNTISFDAPLKGTEGLTLRDTLISDEASPEAIAMDKALLAALYEELDRLDPDGRRICELVAANCTEREGAAILGISKTTYRYRWAKLREKLAEKLKDYT